ncbi:hypothetical protein [Sulfurimonas xiamenensis]|uniref:Uncharacterized protein n=1 Tax=Sulfurimonas xiamenensis TaxID=2590021 RepID=A0AAJ4DN15_9BACT|nr:hypothetical protein [Sulfurimonas xiamenensis]QFR43763.1 hypothetical protein FJR47_07505 [Sulfurimonas xiamenensis]
MKTNKFEDLYDITKNWQLVSLLERTYFTVAQHLSSNYKGGYWESEKLENGWLFLLANHTEYKVDNEILNSKTFSCIVNNIVMTETINALYEIGLENDSFFFEIYDLLGNLNSSIHKILTEVELTQYYKLLD